MRQVKITSRAEADMVQIGNYLERHAGSETANRYISRLRIGCESLRSMSERSRERNEIAPGQRIMVVNPYLIFYRIEGEVVFVQRVLHGARKISPDMLA